MAQFVSCAIVVKLTLFFALTPLKGAASIVALTFSYAFLAQVGAGKNVLKLCNLIFGCTGLSENLKKLPSLKELMIYRHLFVFVVKSLSSNAAVCNQESRWTRHS